MLDEYARGRGDEQGEWEVEAGEVLVELQAPPLPERALSRRETLDAIVLAVRRDERGRG